MQDNRESINKKNAPEGKSAENRKLFFWRIAASVLFQQSVNSISKAIT